MLQSEFLADQVDRVEELPAEELDILLYGTAVAYQLHLAPEGVAAEVAVGGGGKVYRVLEAEALDDGCGTQVENGADLLGYLADRVLEAEALDDGCGTQVEDGADLLGYLAVGQGYPGLAVSVYEDADGLGDAYRVGYLGLRRC